jgi:ATP-dependent DNA helicase DinG
MTEYINTVFGPTGILARHFEGYVPRPGQIEMARAVGAALEKDEHLLVEAPTGVGKSLAYSVPATHHAANKGKRVVIATANIALQEQLVQKDLPLLAEILPWDFRFALLKGKSNYLCLDRLYQGKAKGTLDLLDDSGDGPMLADLTAWAGTTQTGDVSELPFQPPHRLWRRFSTTSDDCKGDDCQFCDECFALKAREATDKAHVVVANYHLLFAHLQVRALTGQNLVLPAFEVAILDEAHKAADIARDFFGVRITSGGVRWAARLLTKLNKGRYRELTDEANRFFERLDSHRRSPGYERRLKRPDVVPWSELCTLLGKAASTYEGAQELGEGDANAELRRVATRCESLARQIRKAMTLADDNSVVFIDTDSRGGAVLRSKPIEVSGLLEKALGSVRERRQCRAYLGHPDRWRLFQPHRPRDRRAGPKNPFGRVPLRLQATGAPGGGRRHPRPGHNWLSRGGCGCRGRGHRAGWGSDAGPFHLLPQSGPDL